MRKWLSKRLFLSGMLSVTGLMPLGLAGCMSTAFPKYSYKLTLNVEVDGRPYSRSSVVEVSSGVGQTISQGLMFHESIKGEGVFLDIGSGRAILTLIGWNAWDESTTVALMKIFGITPNGIEDGGDVEQLAALRETRRLEASQLPAMIVFPSLSDPASYEIIDIKNEAGWLAPGTRLISANITITDERPVLTLEKKIPWLTSVKNYLSGQSSAGPENKWVKTSDIFRR